VGGGQNKDELLPVLLPILGQRLQVLLPFFIVCSCAMSGRASSGAFAQFERVVLMSIHVQFLMYSCSYNTTRLSFPK
jgi:hypothetical protein